MTTYWSKLRICDSFIQKIHLIFYNYFREKVEKVSLILILPAFSEVLLPNQEFEMKT